MVTPGFLPSCDTRKSLYIVGEGREQDAQASRRESRPGTTFTMKSGTGYQSSITGFARPEEALITCLFRPEGRGTFFIS